MSHLQTASILLARRRRDGDELRVAFIDFDGFKEEQKKIQSKRDREARLHANRTIGGAKQGSESGIHSIDSSDVKVGIGSTTGLVTMPIESRKIC